MNQKMNQHSRSVDFPLPNHEEIPSGRRSIRKIDFNVGSVKFSDCLRLLGCVLLNRTNVVNGEFIKEFEGRFARYLGVKNAFSFGAGRMAFYAILKAIGIKQGDEVLVPGYTCVVVPNAVIYCGAKPVYVDVNPNDFCIDFNRIEENISTRTRAIMAQHMFASFCNMEAISRIARKYDLRVIEDCAHALGAEYKGKKAGVFGDAAFFTFEQSKIITTWMGGMAVTNNKELANRLRDIQDGTRPPDKRTIARYALSLILGEISGHPLTSAIGRLFNSLLLRLNVLTTNITSEEMACRKPEKYPLRFSNAQAMIGLRQLAEIKANIEHRREIAGFYDKALRDLGAIVNARTASFNPAYIRYAFLARDRQKLREAFLRNQVDLGVWYNSPLHPKGSSLENGYYRRGSCPVAEFLAEHVANLPTHPKIKMKDINRIVGLLRNSRDYICTKHFERS